MTSDPATPEGRAALWQLHSNATPGPWQLIDDGESIHLRCASGKPPLAPSDPELIVAAVNALPALLDALDDTECEVERQRGDLVIERRRAEAAEAALARVRQLVDSTKLDWWSESMVRAALDGDS